MSDTECRQKYDAAFKEVEFLAERFELQMQKKDKIFSKSYFCWMFEIMLQYSMIELSVVDGNVSKEELAFIREITRYADVVEMSDQVFNVRFEWGDFIGAKVSDIEIWLSNMRKVLLPLQKEFAGGFAAFDRLTKGDSVAVVLEGIYAAMTLFSMADEDEGGVEKAAYDKTFIVQTMQYAKTVLEMSGGRLS